jgi:hypothetical protein
MSFKLMTPFTTYTQQARRPFSYRYYTPPPQPTANVAGFSNGKGLVGVLSGAHADGR